MPAVRERRALSVLILRWTTVAAVLSMAAPAVTVYKYPHFFEHAHLLVLGLLWVFGVAFLLAALYAHRHTLLDEFREADSELSSARRRFEALAAGLSRDFFLYEHDAAGVFVYLSPSFTGMLGYTVAEGRRHYSELLTGHPVNREVVAKTEGSLAGVQQEPYAVEVRHKDGSPRWLEVYEVPMKDPDGRVRTVLGLARDMTAARRAEQALLDVRAAVDQAIDAVAIADLDGTVRFVNDAWARLHGYAPSELIGRHLSMFHTPEQLEREVVPFNEAVRRDGRHAGEVGHVHRDGTVIPTWMSTTLVRRPDGTPDGIVGLARDLRDARKRESLTRELLDSLDELVFVASPGGRLGFVNAAFRAAVGPAAAPGAEASAVFTAETRPHWERAFEEVLMGGAPPPLRASLSGRGGLPIPVELHLRLLRAESDQPEVRVLARDLRLSEALVAQTARAEMLRSLGVFAGGVAHDFNNLLTVIMGRVSLVLDEEGLDPALRQLLDGAQTSAHRASELARQLLSLSKGGASELRPTDVRRLLRETAEFALSGSPVRLVAELPDDLWTVDADTLQLSQVVANLAINAKQAMPHGGTLTVSARNATLTEEEARPRPPLAAGRYVQVEFADTGSGIPDNLLDRIFEPYFTTKDEGSGLGLAVCFAIVDRHAGRLEAASRPGQGAVFRFWLRASERREPERETPPPRPVRGRGTVLVLDDEPEVLATTCLILERTGFETAKAAEGKRALELAREARAAGRPFAAALLDLTVKGGLGGGDIIADLRRQEPGLPVVACTGYITPGLEKDLLKQGFTALLPKPFTGRTLGRLLASVLAEKDG